jgi:formate-dependent nitrite reductase membrane component NrfD
MDPRPEAVVTLDVLHSGVIWGWYVTMNFWAKSVSTGVLLLAPFLFRRGVDRRARFVVAAIAFVFINVTLLFTVLDLHQPFRFWHMFVYPHPTSLINLGAFLLTVYDGLLFLMLAALWRRRDGLYDALVWPTWVVAFLSTIYTAGLLGQANAREVWHAPTEVAQMLLAAGLAGSAAHLLSRRDADDVERRALAWVLGLSAALSLTIFVAELWLAPQKSEEAEVIIHLLVTGRLGALFATGLVVGFVLPTVMTFIAVRRRRPRLLMAAGVLGLVGLGLVKHAWLIAPQLIPLS